MVMIAHADLISVVQHTPGLKEGQLVSISQYDRTPNVIGPTLAVGRMAIDSESFRDEDRKGKAVIILHTWKDHLWIMGAGGEVPEGRTIASTNGTEAETPSAEEDINGHSSPTPAQEAAEDTPLPTTEPDTSNNTDVSPPGAILSPQGKIEIATFSLFLTLMSPNADVTIQLRSALIQAISTTLHAMPSSNFPITSSTFYTTYILPYRRFDPTPPTTPVDIKHSTFKSLTAFLKSTDKDGLIKLKEMKGKGSTGGDVVITAVYPNHKDVLAHVKHATVGEVEAKREKKEARAKERQEEERKKGRELIIKELWKPHLQTVSFFDGAGQG
jgi:translation initiation factor 2D